MRWLKLSTALLLTSWLFQELLLSRFQSFDTSTIRLAFYGNYQDYQTWQVILQLFHAQHPEIKIIPEYTPGFGGEYEGRLQRQILAGNTPDLFLLQDESLPYYVDNHLLPLNKLLTPEDLEILTQAWVTTARESLRWDDVQYGVPVSGGCLLIYLNLQALQQAEQIHGPLRLPTDEWTIEQFLQLARQLTLDKDGDGRCEQFGFWHPWWGYFQSFFWSIGADLFDASRSHWVMNGPAAEQAWQLYQDLLCVEKVCPAPGELGQMRQDIAFLSGRVAMVINGPWFIPLVENSSLKGQYRVMPIPRGPGGRWTRLTWDGLVVRKDLPEQIQQEARTFLLFLNSSDVQQVILNSQRFFPPGNTIGKLTVAPPLQPFIEALAYARLHQITPHWKDINKLISRRVSTLLSGKQSVAEFLNELANEPVIRQNYPAP
ncbi:MAG: hypothetical protein HJJLKODD_02231 [Phycisphaerae bacterium]|nr:hypothetical protein [Phycisphaerae bacterium]